MAYYGIEATEVEWVLDNYTTGYTDSRANPVRVGVVNGRGVVVLVRGANPRRVRTVWPLGRPS